MKKRVKKSLLFAVACISLLMAGCNKKEEPEGPVDEVLTAITLNDLTPGNFYVKSGDSYYLLPVEDGNFDTSKPATTTDDSQNGMTDPEENRIVDFIYKDAAIPTLYRNDQLVYVSDGSIAGFTWERFNDYGYSIGLSGLELAASGKVTSGANTRFSAGSSISASLSAIGAGEGVSLTVDAINGTPLSSQYLNDAGVITGMSKDATANIDFYSGTQHVPVTAKADTRYFKSFELYQTAQYSLSTDGYAIVEIPSYLKSGYYLLNNTGFVKFLNVDRGVDESGIDLTIPYYYEGDDGSILTYYEWQEANGMAVETPEQVQQNNLDIESYQERMRLNIDSTQESITFSVAYRYINDSYATQASQTGAFPRVAVMDPYGNITQLDTDEAKTNSADNKEGYTYLTAEVPGASAGEWYILFSNFDNIHKVVDCDLSSGNATSWLHTSGSSRGEIYYEASDAEHEFVITWENTDRAASSVRIEAPDGTVYDAENTPGSVTSEFGRYVIHVPNLVSGTYSFDIRGESLGRVWVNCNEVETSVAVTETQATGETVPADTAAQETAAAQ